MPHWVPWIMFGVAVSVVGIILFSFYNASIAQAARIPENVEDELVLASRFYNSDNCFAYKDDFGRAHARVIDSAKFNQGNMEECFPESSVKYAYSLSLEESPTPATYPIWTFNTEPIKTFNWPGGIATKEITEDVLVVYNNKKYDGKLRIKIKNVE